VTDDEHALWWVALNGSSCAIAPTPMKRPKVSPVPEQMIGFRTWGEAKEAQRVCLQAPKDEVRRYLLSLWPDIVAGRIIVIVPPTPEPPTLKESALDGGDGRARGTDGSHRGGALSKGAHPMGSRDKIEARLIGELDRLIQKLPTYGPLADVLRSRQIDPKSRDAWRLSAIMVVHLCRALTKLPRPKSNRWTAETDLALEVQMIGLCYGPEGLGERKAIKKLAATWEFPYTPQTGRRSPKSAPRTQREEALLSRWKDLKRRNSFVDARLKIGAGGEINLNLTG
jgi:hypothetical protein